MNSPDAVAVVGDNYAAEKLKAVLELKAEADESEADVAKSKNSCQIVDHDSVTLGAGRDPLAGTDLLNAKANARAHEMVQETCDNTNLTA